VNGSDNTVVF